MRRFPALFFVLICCLLTGCGTARQLQIQPEPYSNTPVQINIAPAQQALPANTPAQETTPPEETAAPEEAAPTEEAQDVPQAPPPVTENSKIVYLTFDDGPSKNTEGLLKILADEEVPATFFVVGENAERHPERIKAIDEAGHLVANHTYSHNTKEIYKNADALLDNIKKCQDVLVSILGEDYPTDLFRFPKGSTNKGCRDLRKDVREAGYRYFDWNALNGDAETGEYKRTAQELYERFKQTVDDVDGRKNEVIVLMHDTNSKENTVAMLQDAIRYLKSLGYEFRTLQYAEMK